MKYNNFNIKTNSNKSLSNKHNNSIETNYL